MRERETDGNGERSLDARNVVQQSTGIRFDSSLMSRLVCKFNYVCSFVRSPRNLPVPSSSFLSSSIVVAVSLLHCKLVWTWKIENLCWFSVAFRLAPSQRKIYIFHRNGLISIYQQFSQIPVNLFIHLLLLLTVICTEYIRSHSHPTLPLRPLLVSYNCLLGYNLDDADEWRVERLAHILYGSPFELNARKHFGIIIKSTIFVMV